ncbi:hypothetical protein [Dysgonomonas termitidis]|uniref:Uncharacterized protein n=1 Tax=Dysgonomonas termitidis TaxID=1516126 RepID=A0ABV9KZ27_9BACT
MKKLNVLLNETGAGRICDTSCLLLTGLKRRLPEPKRGNKDF